MTGMERVATAGPSHCGRPALGRLCGGPPRVAPAGPSRSGYDRHWVAGPSDDGGSRRWPGSARARARARVGSDAPFVARSTIALARWSASRGEFRTARAVRRAPIVARGRRIPASIWPTAGWKGIWRCPNSDETGLGISSYQAASESTAYEWNEIQVCAHVRRPL